MTSESLKALGLTVLPTLFARGDEVSSNVGYWHLADIAARRLMSAFGGKADIEILGRRCPLLTLIVALLRDFGAVQQMPSVVS